MILVQNYITLLSVLMFLNSNILLLHAADNLGNKTGELLTGKHFSYVHMRRWQQYDTQYLYMPSPKLMIPNTAELPA